MKSTIALFIALSGISFAVPWGPRVTTFDGSGVTQIITSLNLPTGGGYGVMGFDPTITTGGATGKPLMFTLGSDFSAVGGSFTLSYSFYSSLNTSLDDLQDQIDALDSGAFSGAWNDLTGKPSTFPPSSHTHPWSDITSTPTSLAGYGITDPVVLTSGSYANPAWITSLAYSKLTGAPTNVSSFTNDSGYLTGITSGQITTALGYTPFNLPSQTGNSGKVLGTNGTATSWVTPNAGTVTSVGLTSSTLTITGSPVTTSGSFTAEIPNVGTAGTYSGVTTDSKGRVTAGTTRSFSNTASRSIQTVAASANGVQISSTRDAAVHYSVSITTTATIGGASTGYVVLEICPTNSSTAGDWIEIGRTTNSQTITLAVALQSVQVNGTQLNGHVPAGYYSRLRSVSSAGSPSFSYVSGQEITL